MPFEGNIGELFVDLHRILGIPSLKFFCDAIDEVLIETLQRQAQHAR